MPNNNLPIGVFDSGVGGLTVLNELIKHFPHESFIYLGDTARLPYGTKSPETIRHYSKQMTDILVGYKIKLLVIACNSATSASVPYLQSQFPDLPIMGVVEPGVRAALRETKKNTIAVLATEATITSQIYQKTIQAFNPNAKVESQSCGLLVALAEEGIIDHEIAVLTVKKYLNDINQKSKNYDVLVLGCTHFPVFTKIFKKILGGQVHIVNSAQETALTVANELDRLNLRTTNAKKSLRFMVTDLPERFIRVSKIFLEHPVEADLVSLVDIPAAKCGNQIAKPWAEKS